jgi:hypothetical protein
MFFCVQYKSKPSKVMSVCGWMVVLCNDPLCPDAFQLQDPSNGLFLFCFRFSYKYIGLVYKFRAGTQAYAMQWVAHLKEAALKNQQRLPENLIAFD